MGATNRCCWSAMPMLAALHPATAQEPGRAYRVGILAADETPVASMRQYVPPELAKAGFVERRSLMLDVRSAPKR